MNFVDVVMLAVCSVGLGFALSGSFLMARAWLMEGDGGSAGFGNGLGLALGASVLLAVYGAVNGSHMLAMWLVVAAILLVYIYLRLEEA